MMTLIEVSADDIAKGKRKSCGECMLTRAICRAVGMTPEENQSAFEAGAYTVRTYLEDVAFGEVFSEDSESSPLPDVAIEARQDFDAGRQVSPFGFEIDIPLFPDNGGPK
jgi:hypothetical protein